MTVLHDQPTASLTGTWDIDPTHSEVAFSVRHLMVSKVRGRFTDFSGAVVVGDDLRATGVEATIGVASIDTHLPDRDEHLRSPDFFDADRFPEMRYRSTGVREAGHGYVVDGELTIRGVTRAVPLALELLGHVAETPFGDSRVGFSARAEIDRRDFGLGWNAAVEGGGVVVGHRIQIELEIEAIRRADA